MALKGISYKNYNFEINYSLVQNDAQRNMLLIHGWGSNKELMRLAFENYFSDFNHIYIDLPGFGASSNDVFIDTFDYANIVDIFLDTISVNGKFGADVVLGHSYGGKIALLLGREIILLSSAGIVLEKSLTTRLKIKLAKLAKLLNLNLNFLRASDARTLSPVMYEVFKHIVDEDFSMYYRDFKYRASIFWGDKDIATPIESFERIRGLMSEGRFFVLQGDHYFFLKQGKQVQDLYNSTLN